MNQVCFMIMKLIVLIISRTPETMLLQDAFLV